MLFELRNFLEGRDRVKLSNDQKRLVPLTPAVFFILFALADGEKHGYAIMQQVGLLSERKFRMGPGTLYTTLQRLLALRLIEETARKDERDERRRYYRLTAAGRNLLEAELGRLQALVLAAQQKRLTPQHVE
jgi:DNA-binding PadR family transcriptional regulator